MILGFLLIGLDTLYAQTASDDSIIMLRIINQYIHNNKIAYVDTVSFGGIYPEPITKIIKSNKIHDVNKTNKTNTLILTRNEKKYILSKISNQTIWGKDLFPNSIVIPPNKVINFLADQRNSLIKALDTISIRNDQVGIHYVFSFTKPIYFRNQTLCLITYIAICGSTCGVFKTIILRKEHDVWENWIIAESGEF